MLPQRRPQKSLLKKPWSFWRVVYCSMQFYSSYGCIELIKKESCVCVPNTSSCKVCMRGFVKKWNCCLRNTRTSILKVRQTFSKCSRSTTQYILLEARNTRTKLTFIIFKNALQWPHPNRSIHILHLLDLCFGRCRWRGYNGAFMDTTATCGSKLITVS